MDLDDLTVTRWHNHAQTDVKSKRYGGRKKKRKLDAVFECCTKDYDGIDHCCEETRCKSVAKFASREFGDIISPVCYTCDADKPCANGDENSEDELNENENEVLKPLGCYEEGAFDNANDLISTGKTPKECFDEALNLNKKYVGYDGTNCYATDLLFG